MNYVTDEKGNHILDENGNKIVYYVFHEDGELYKHYEEIHINDDGCIDTEDRHIVIKEGINNNHAVCKKQLDQVDTNTKEYTDKKLSEFKTSINTYISSLFKAHEAKILSQMLNFRNDQVKNRFMRKQGSLPKIVNEVHKILDISDVSQDTKTLNDITITAVYFERKQWFFDARSALVEASFKNTLEFMFNSDFTSYNAYFTNYDNFWSYRYIVEFIRLPKVISIDNENANNNI